MSLLFLTAQEIYASKYFNGHFPQTELAISQKGRKSNFEKEPVCPEKGYHYSITSYTNLLVRMRSKDPKREI